MGLFISKGAGFGGDFLAYPGDQLAFHGLYVVQVRGPDDEIRCLDLVAFGRVSHGTKKIGVSAAVNDQDSSVQYARIEWFGN